MRDCVCVNCVRPSAAAQRDQEISVFEASRSLRFPWLDGSGYKRKTATARADPKDW